MYYEISKMPLNPMELRLSSIETFLRNELIDWKENLDCNEPSNNRLVGIYETRAKWCEWERIKVWESNIR